MNFFRKSFSFRLDHERRTLGYDPKVGYQEGARATAAWYAEEGLLGG